VGTQSPGDDYTTGARVAKDFLTKKKLTQIVLPQKKRGERGIEEEFM